MTPMMRTSGKSNDLNRSCYSRHIVLGRKYDYINVDKLLRS